MAKMNHPEHTGALLRSLGVDPFQHNHNLHGDDLFVEGFTDEQLLAAEAALDVPALNIEAEDNLALSRRVQEYPAVGDQLDVIWKQLNQLRMEGTPLIQEADDMLGAILNVKKRHPKVGAV